MNQVAEGEEGRLFDSCLVSSAGARLPGPPRQHAKHGPLPYVCTGCYHCLIHLLLNLKPPMTALHEIKGLEKSMKLHVICDWAPKLKTSNKTNLQKLNGKEQKKKKAGILPV